MWGEVIGVDSTAPSSHPGPGPALLGAKPRTPPSGRPQGARVRGAEEGRGGWTCWTGGLQGEHRANTAGVKVRGVAHRAGGPRRASAVAVLMPEMHLPGGALRDQNGAGAQADAPGGPCDASPTPGQAAPQLQVPRACLQNWQHRLQEKGERKTSTWVWMEL